MLAPVRFSNLKYMAQSPAHYRERLLNPPEPSRAMRIGTCAHAALLGGNVVVYDGDRRGKAWLEFEDAHAGQEIVTRAEWVLGEAMADAVRADLCVAKLLARVTDREACIGWMNGRRACKGRVDAFGGGVLLDLKTCADASPGRFAPTAVRMGYLAQMAWYADGLAMNGVRADEVYIIAVESKPPHVVQVYEITPASLDFGRAQYSAWFERLLQCEAADEWPGYVQSIVPLEPPVELGDVTLSIGDEEVSL